MGVVDKAIDNTVKTLTGNYNLPFQMW